MTFLDPALWTGKVYIDGWADGAGEALEIREASTGDSLGILGTASVAQARQASSSAAAAQHYWAGLRPADRAAVLRRAGDLFEAHGAEIEEWIVRESGGTPAKGAREVQAAAAECYEAAGLPSHPHGNVLTSNQDRWSFARRRPAGVVTVIAPFNFPLTLSIRSVAPALALGNSVLLKPDPRTSVSGGVVLARIFEEAGLPSGVLQLLPGGADVGEAVVVAPEVRIISFTGSTAAGRRVGEAAAKHLKRAHLELGGNNAIVVLPGADVALAASAGAYGSFVHQGQICMATGRHLVHLDLYEEYVAALSAKADALIVGDPYLQKVHLGPIIDERQLKAIDAMVQSSIMAGATVRAGATHAGPYYRPTVLSDITREMPVWREETFGPIAPVLPFSTLEQAAELVNEGDYGLSVGILGGVGNAMKLADMINTGKVHINEQTVSDEANAPFGGMGASGTGSRFGGAEANIEAFTETQWLTMRPDIETYPF
ncbi:MAG: benzaldehyde dehydrogenase [Cellulosimicrobium cellulans]